MRTRLAVLAAAIATAAVAATVSTSVTYSKDIAPILQRNCQGCHRPGEAAPMSLLTYQEARPWAKAIREAVLVKRMPPWFADPHFGKWSNDVSMPQAEVDTLVAWADGGAREGNPKDLPPPRKFVDGWNIGLPDAVIEMPQEFRVAASGTIEYQYVVIPTGFTGDKWVRMAEIRPGNRAVVHHVIGFIREPGSTWMKDAKPGEPFVPRRRYDDPQRGREANREANPEGSRPAPERSNERGAGSMLVGFAPGMQPQVLPAGHAILVKAGSDLVFQMHYTANGKPGLDRTKIGLIFAKEPVTRRVLIAPATNNKFVIPPGAGNHQVDSEITIQSSASLIALMPHMHLRGKDFEYRLVRPAAAPEVMLRVPKYNFNWQLFYYFDKPLELTKGTKIECTAHFDNSPNNPDNPDPASEVKWGDQSWEEMMIGWFSVAFDPSMKPEDLFQRERRPAARPSSD